MGLLTQIDPGHPVVKDGKNPNVKSICDIMKYGNNGDGKTLNKNYDKANETGVSYTHCKKCPQSLEGGVDAWSKEKKGGYHRFYFYLPY